MGPRPLREVGRSNGEGQVGHAGALDEPSRGVGIDRKSVLPRLLINYARSVSHLCLPQWSCCIHTVSQGRAENIARLYAYIGNIGQAHEVACLCSLLIAKSFHGGEWRNCCGNSVRRFSMQCVVEERDLRYGRLNRWAGTAKRRAEHSLACGTTLALELHLTTSTSVTTWHYLHSGGFTQSLHLHRLLPFRFASFTLPKIKFPRHEHIGRRITA